MKRRLAVGAAIVIVFVVGLSVALWQARSRQGTSEAFGEVGARLAEVAKEASNLEASYDVVVERSVSGGLSVRGRAVQRPVAFASVQEFRAFLKTLPSPGSGVALVSWDTVNGIDGLLASPPPAASAARAELEAALKSAGFQVPEPRPLLESRHP